MNTQINQTGDPSPALSSHRRVEISNLLWVGLGLIWCHLTQTRQDLLSFALGGLLNIINFRLLIYLVVKLTSATKPKKTKLIFTVVFKFALMLGGLAFLLLKVDLNPIYFLLGLSTIVVAIVLEGVWGLLR